MFRASALLTLCLLPGILLACDSASDDSYTPDSETLIAIDPTDFPTVTACAQLEDGSLPGGSYVAELIDVTHVISTNVATKVGDFSVQRSAPEKCGVSIAFARAQEDRSYEVNVNVYADADGDPKTVDICTVEGTSVAVIREDGKCTQTLAIPTATLRCYGWVQQTVNTNKNSSHYGQVESLQTEPAIAILYRTVYARYCVDTAIPK